ncbi:hypothetical protein [Paraliomyxa miuraensis]|uniref:hypothetical protein n=1 Tax=Paraliomyxa miuraensis TaxID=376150 RepID=UPI0022590BD0|nr:hypothetical protein [Paraliomyxa miuraensis]MCX4245996.1 hypothetical protein [Paraliomyxa miuraensis]
MTEAAVILEIRNVRLAEQATLQPTNLGPSPSGADEEGVFVALDDPPPVRTVLTVIEGEQRRALEVVWVVEVPERNAARGFHGRWVGDEVRQRAAKVGTEHLEDGTPVVQPVVPDNSLSMDVSDAVMAMPAPVMIHDDDTGTVDEGEDEERAASDDEGGSDEAAVEQQVASDEGGSDDASAEQQAASDDEGGSDEASAEQQAASDEGGSETSEGDANAEGEAAAEGDASDDEASDEAGSDDDPDGGGDEPAGEEAAASDDPAASEDGKKRRRKRSRRRK